MMEFTSAPNTAISRGLDDPTVSIDKETTTFFDDSESSNPQQGTTSATSNSILSNTLATDSMAKLLADGATSYSTTGADTTAKGSGKVPLFVPKKRAMRSSMKIPPTLKDSRKLFVGGLPMDVTSHEFLVFFQQFGNVVDSVVMFDRETRKPRGFGFVTYDDPEVCRRLLRMGQMMDTLDEEKQSDNASAFSSGRLEMRGKLIEIKAAQPKEPAPKGQPVLPSPYVSSSKFPYESTDYFNGNSSDHDGSTHYNFGAKHPATLPHFKYTPNVYGYSTNGSAVPAAAPPSPSIYAPAEPATPITPQMAMDMAHHMMFYSQLLATPTLISPLLSPMISPMILGYDHHYQQYSQSFQPYRPSEPQTPTTPTYQQFASTSSTAAPPAPDVSKPSSGASKAKPAASPFRIGGATFYPEEPLSPEVQQVALSLKALQVSE